jgi:hypothetical protein
MKATISWTTGWLILLLAALPAQAALFDRGAGLIYDDVFDITWVQDANLARTSGYDDDGLMNAARARAWADALVYRGYDDWRLPDPCSPDGSQPLNGWEMSANEMGSMFYVTLGNQATYDVQDFSGLTHTGPFINLEPFRYYTGTPWYWATDCWWYFNFGSGLQFDAVDGTDCYAWAVRDGDSTPVPAPGVLWLLASGLVCGGAQRVLFSRAMRDGQ